MTDGFYICETGDLHSRRSAVQCRICYGVCMVIVVRCVVSLLV